MSASRQTRTYAFHGLHIESALELVELVPVPADHARSRTPDVRIELGPVPAALDGASKLVDEYEVSADATLLAIPNVGRYLAHGGHTLTIEPFPGADPGALQLYLIGSGLAAVLHQRGLLPLHCCAIEHQGGCIAFAGDSGAGKSTLAAMLSKRGHRLVTDDVLVIRPAEGGAMMAEPSLPILKLWPQSLDAAGLDHAPAPFEALDYNKHRLAAPERFADKPLPFKRLYILRWLMPATAAPEIVALDGFAALMALRRNVYRPSLIEAMGREQAFMGQAAMLLSAARAFEFRRPMDLAGADAQIDALLEHVARN